MELEDRILALLADPQLVHWRPRRQVHQLKALGLSSAALKAKGWQWIDGKWVGHGPEAAKLKDQLEAVLDG